MKHMQNCLKAAGLICFGVLLTVASQHSLFNAGSAQAENQFGQQEVFAEPNSPHPFDVRIIEQPISVGINGTPNVHALPIGSPFQRGLAVDDPGGTTSFTVPAGFRLVIETITMTTRAFGEGSPYQGTLSTVVAGVTCRHAIEPSEINHPPIFPRLTCMRQVRIYADPGTEVTYSAENINAPSLVNVSGVLIPVE